MNNFNISNTNNCNHSKWIYIRESNLWWKVPGVNKCEKNFPHHCLPNDDDKNNVIVLQDKKCFRCNSEIHNNFFFLTAFYYKNNIFCNLCIKIIDSKKNITSLIIKREYTNFRF